MHEINLIKLFVPNLIHLFTKQNINEKYSTQSNFVFEIILNVCKIDPVA